MARQNGLAILSCVAILGWVTAAAPRAAAQRPSADGGARRVTVRVAQQKAERTKRWIGVACDAIPAGPLRSHIGVPEGQGLLVSQVVSDSPAHEAGLAVNDILLEVDGEALTSQEQLVDAVAKSKDDGLELKWLHHGDTRTKVIKPVRRPEEAPEMERFPFRFDFQPSDVLRRRDVTAPFHMRFFGPALELPHKRAEEFPADLEIKVEKKGKEPAKIVVNQGDKHWEISEEALNELPEEVRPFVQRFLGGNFTIPLPGFPGGDGKMDIDLFQVPANRQFFRQFAPFDIDKKLEDLDRRMDQLYDELKQLRGADDDAKDAEPDSDDEDDAPKSSV